MPDEEVKEVKEVTKQDDTTPEWADRSKWELKQRAILRQEYEQLFEVWKTKELIELEKKQDAVITEGLQKYYDKWKEEQKPPDPEDIQKLLDQEYETFSIKVEYHDDNEEGKSELFTIRELPQTAEIKFTKQFTDRVLKKLPELQAFDQANINATFEDKAKAFMSVLNESFDAIADTVVIALNPFGKKKHVDKEWVQNNISSNRQWNIVEAQLKVNRVKDFFSRLYQSGQQTQMMMTGQRFQVLQQLAR